MATRYRQVLKARSRWRRLYTVWYVFALCVYVVMYFAAAIGLGIALSFLLSAA